MISQICLGFRIVLEPNLKFSMNYPLISQMGERKESLKSSLRQNSKSLNMPSKIGDL